MLLKRSRSKNSSASLCSVTVSQRQRLGQPVVQQDPIGQIGEAVVLRQMSHLERQRPRHAHVTKHHDGAGHVSPAIVDRCGGVFDGGFGAVAPDQDAVRLEPYGLVFQNCQRHGILHASRGCWRRRCRNTSSSGRPAASSCDQPVMLSATALR